MGKIMVVFFLSLKKIGLTPSKAEHPLLGMELQEKEVQED